jgi:RNA polymerase sigma-70 factor (ECF subfamily)
MEHSNELLLSKDDAHAFTKLYELYWEKLYVIARNRLNDPALAEDIVHDVFLALWKNRKNTKINSLENYLTTATKYLVLTQIKKKAYAEKYVQEVGKTAQPSFDVTLNDALHHRRVLELVQKEIDLLPEKCKLIFQYSREEGMSAKEIATVLELSKKTVDNQIQKALDRIRGRLKQVLSSMLSLIL